MNYLSNKLLKCTLASLFLAGTSVSVMAANPKEAAKPKAAASGFDKSMDDYLAKDENIEKLIKAVERYSKKAQEEQMKKMQEQEAKQTEEQFKNPKKIDIGTSPVRGPKDAKVTIVAFSDFECPFCSKGAAVMDEVMKMYPKEVNVVFKNLPLPFHQNAKPAAIAALAAGKQNKFWEMHDLLFKNQQELTEAKFLELANTLGLDKSKFAADLKDEALAKQIESDESIAKTMGISGTPGFFVNGVEVKGARPASFFKTIIDRWLKEAKA